MENAKSMRSVAQCHEDPGDKSVYFRPGDEISSIKVELTKGPRNALQIALRSPRWHQAKIAFTAKCKALTEPKRHDDDEKNPLTVSVASGQLNDWLRLVATKIEAAVGTQAQFNDPVKTDLFGEEFVRAKLFKNPEPRWIDKDGEKTEPFALADKEIYIMAMLRAYAMNGSWGLTVDVYQIQAAS